MFERKNLKLLEKVRGVLVKEYNSLPQIVRGCGNRGRKLEEAIDFLDLSIQSYVRS